MSDLLSEYHKIVLSTYWTSGTVTKLWILNYRTLLNPSPPDKPPGNPDYGALEGLA